MIRMLGNYLERGDFDIVLSYFKNDTEIYPLIGELIIDERIRVRMGIVAIVESIINTHAEELKVTLPYLAKHLSDENPVIRGDIAFVLGLIAGDKAMDYLKPLLNDPNPHVVEIVEEFLSD